MKLREIISLLGSNPIFNQTTPAATLTRKDININSNDDFILKPKNLIAISNQFHEIYYLCSKTRKLYIIRIEYSLENTETIYQIKYQELVINIEFDVYRISLNDNSRYLCLVGNFEWCLLDLNPAIRSSFFQSEPIRVFDEINTDQYQSLKCDLIYLDNSLLSFKELNVNILQIEWHPLSSTHLLVLYSNNQLKLFNTNRDKSSEVEYEQIFNLGKLFIKSAVSEQPENRNLQFKSFCFGPTINYWTRFTLFFLDEMDQIYSLCPVIPNNCLIETQYLLALQQNILAQRSSLYNLQKQQQQQPSFKQQKQTNQQLHYFDNILKWLLLSTQNRSLESLTSQLQSNQWIKFRSVYNSKDRLYEPMLQGPLFSLGSSTASSLHDKKKQSMGGSKLGYSIHCISSNYQPNEEETSSQRNHLSDLKDEEVESNFNNVLDEPPSINFNREIPYSLLIVQYDGTIVVTVSCADSLPLWNMKDHGFPIKFDDICKFNELIKYETLDIGLPEKSRIPPKKIEYYTSFSFPGVFIDQINECAYIYHNCGVNTVQFPWLSTLTKMLNSTKKSNLELESSNMLSVIITNPLNTNSASPIISLGVLNDVKIGRYLITLTNRDQSSPIMFDLNGLAQHTALQLIGSTSQATIDSSLYTSPLTNLVKLPDPIPRLQVPKNLSMKDTLLLIVKVKDTIYNYQKSLNLLEATIESRLKTLANITEEQKSTIKEINNNINDIKQKQNQLQETMSQKWDDQKSYHEKISELTIQTYKDLPLSYEEKELRSEIQIMSNKIQVYKDKLNYFDEQFKLKQPMITAPKFVYSKEPLSSRDQIDIQKKIQSQSQNINESTELLLKLTNEIQEFKLRS